MKYTYSAGRVQINASGKQGNMNKFLYAGTNRKGKSKGKRENRWGGLEHQIYQCADNGKSSYLITTRVRAR